MNSNFSDEDLTEAATVDSCHMWFSIANCGLTPVVRNGEIDVHVKITFLKRL